MRRILCIGIVLLFLLSATCALAVSNTYGHTLTRLRVRDGASSGSALLDNLEADRLLYITESRDSGGTTFLYVKYRTAEGKLARGWVAQTSGSQTLVELMSDAQVQADYSVRNGDLPPQSAGLKSAKEREALRSGAGSGEKPESEKSTQKDSGISLSEEEIRQLQTRLRELGFYAGDITGNAGAKTLDAVRAFQKKYGLTVDGIPGPGTLRKLEEVLSGKTAGSSAPAPEKITASQTEAPSISLSESEIRQLQTRLRELGFYTGDITGNAGAKTLDAVRAFQKKYGLTVDGIPGPGTLRKLEEVLSGKTAGNSATAPEKITASQTDAPSISLSESEIRQLQTRLRDLGYYAGDITGNAGSKTLDAVRAFQKKYGLTVDGIPGPGTLHKLEEVVSGKAAGSSVTAPEKITASQTEAPSISLSESEIRQLQTRLRVLGFYAGDITGNAGSKTLDAVRAFQKKYGLTVDGIPGPGTLQKLEEVASGKTAGSTAPAQEKASASQTEAPSISLSESEIRQLQTRLRDLGFYAGEITGNAGSKTLDAVRAFQKKYGLTVDGIPGPGTLRKLEEVVSGKSSTGSSEKTSSTGGAPAVSLSESEIRQLQTRLRELGFYTGDITGNAGEKTLEAVRTFQKKYGLTADGIPGPGTLRKLEEISAARTSSKKDASSKQSVSTSAAPSPNAHVSRSVIEDAQTKLKALGFYSGEITGSSGSKTVGAIQAFQKKYGLTPDGILGSSTLNKLNSVYRTQQSGSSQKTAEDKTASANRRVSSGTIRSVQSKLKDLGLYSGDITGTAGEKTAAAVKAFQKKYGLTADGIIGSSTLRKINNVHAAANRKSSSSSSSSSSSRRVYNLDWFAAKKNHVLGQLGLNKGHSLRLLDLGTGKSLNVVIQSTGNHLDVEPATSADTKVLLSIYHVTKPEKITFLRRPGMITTEYGYRIVCSIYGQPHGSELIHANGYKGQFCLHFLNSKTHGSSHVDGDHQDAIRKAVLHYGGSDVVRKIRSLDDL